MKKETMGLLFVREFKLGHNMSQVDADIKQIFL